MNAYTKEYLRISREDHYKGVADAAELLAALEDVLRAWRYVFDSLGENDAQRCSVGRARSIIAKIRGA